MSDPERDPGIVPRADLVDRRPTTAEGDRPGSPRTPRTPRSPRSPRSPRDRGGRGGRRERDDGGGAARSLPAGLADVGLASLTSFVVGIDAARNLDAVSLGLWGLIFSAYLLAAVVPTEFLLVPLEAALVSRPGDEQLRAVPRTMVIAAMVGVPASMLAMALAASFSRDVPASTAGRVAAIGVVLGVTSPLQDHLRRLLHQAGWSAGAAAVSCVQVVVVIAAVIGLHAADVDSIYVPPLALALSNVVSLLFGVLAARGRAGAGTHPPVRLRRATRVGGWLLGAGVADRATQFACLALLSLWVGNGGVGQYEATRVAAQPVLVFALGVLSVYRRPLMRSAQERLGPAAVRVRRTFTALVAAAATGYGLLIMLPWSANPLTELTPAAYEQAGFLAAVIVATAITASAMAPTTELVGSGHSRPYARRIAQLSGALVGLCLLALVLGFGVFAWPIALGVRSLLLGVLLRRETAAVYRLA